MKGEHRAILHRINSRLAEEMGLNYPDNRLHELHRGVQAVCQQLGWGEGDDCLDRFRQIEFDREQIELLASHLTIGETYYFREPQSFQALETTILPPLISRRRETSRILRFWSAGCSSGEEAYSIAILLQRMIPDWRDWSLTILATDINPTVLAKAQRGIYRPWSFRGSDEAFRKKYFTPAGENSLQIKPEVREMVQFAYLNLADAGSYPALATNTLAVDAIFCRNVLMYFSDTGIRQTGKRFGQALVDGGWLVLSPSEASRHYFPDLEPVNFPGTIFFNKTGRPAPSEPLLPPPLPPEEVVDAAPLPSWEDVPLAPLASLPRGEGDPEEPVPAEVEHRDSAGAVRALADQGRLPEALELCGKLLSRDRLEVTLHYLQASLQQETGDVTGAIRTLRGALFLQPNFVMAHFLLGNLLRQQGKVSDAKRHLSRAAGLLEDLPAEGIPPEGEGLTAARIQQMITANLKATH